MDSTTRRPRTHRHLVVWQKAIRLTVASYRLSSSSRAECAHFLAIARGSVRELDSQLELAFALEFVRDEEVSDGKELAEEVSRMLTAMLRRFNPF